MSDVQPPRGGRIRTAIAKFLRNLDWGTVGGAALGVVGIVVGIVFVISFIGVVIGVLTYVWTNLPSFVAHNTAVLWGQVVPIVFAGSVKQGLLPASLDYDHALGIGTLFLIICLILILRVNITIRIKTS